MVDFGESNMMDKSDTNSLVVTFRSLFKNFFRLMKKFLNKEWNVTTKLFGNVWFVLLSTYFYYIFKGLCFLKKKLKKQVRQRKKKKEKKKIYHTVKGITHGLL